MGNLTGLGLLIAGARYVRRVTAMGKDEAGGKEFRRVAEEFRVSRDTVQRVLQELRNEGWIESVFVESMKAWFESVWTRLAA